MPIIQIQGRWQALKHGKFLCKGYIQNRLVDQLFNVYSEIETSKDLWDALEKRYKSFNEGSGKFATAKFFNFGMVDSRPIMEQVHEIQLIFQEFADEGVKLCEIFTVNCSMEKLHQSWEDFKNYLAYKQKALTLENLITRLQKRDKDGPFRTQDANVAEYRNKGKVEARFQKFELKLIQKAPSNFKRQAQPPMKNNFGGRCGNCGKMRHKSSECRRKAMGKINPS